MMKKNPVRNTQLLNGALSEFNRSPARFLFWRAWEAAAFVLCLASILPFLEGLYWRFDLLAGFRVPYLLALLPVTAVFFLRKRWKTGGTCAGFFLFNLFLILCLYWGRPATPQKGDKPLRAVYMNVLGTNNRHKDVIDFLRSKDPDFFVLCEVNPRWDSCLKEELGGDYPYYEGVPRNDFYGVIIMSRIPITKAKIHTFVRNTGPTLEAHLTTGGHDVTVIGTHAFPPAFRTAAMLRNKQLRVMADYIRELPGDVILLGDLNNTSWSLHFRDFIRRSGLRDSRRGFGLQTTWHSRLPAFLRITIDHCLVSKDIRIAGHEIGPYIGSDHLPIIVDYLHEKNH